MFGASSSLACGQQGADGNMRGIAAVWKTYQDTNRERTSGRYAVIDNMVGMYRTNLGLLPRVGVGLWIVAPISQICSRGEVQASRENRNPRPRAEQPADKSSKSFYSKVLSSRVLVSDRLFICGLGSQRIDSRLRAPGEVSRLRSFPLIAVCWDYV